MTTTQNKFEKTTFLGLFSFLGLFLFCSESHLRTKAEYEISILNQIHKLMVIIVLDRSHEVGTVRAFVSSTHCVLIDPESLLYLVEMMLATRCFFFKITCLKGMLSNYYLEPKTSISAIFQSNFYVKSQTWLFQEVIPRT